MTTIITFLLLFLVFLSGYFLREIVEKNTPKQIIKEEKPTANPNPDKKPDVYDTANAIANFNRRTKNDKDKSS